MLRHALPGLALLLVLAGSAWPAAAQPLNSERIEQTFGSYGISLIHSDARLRLSNLYSTHAGVPVTRTFAIVAYPQAVDPGFAAEHEAVLAGGSIGATFQAAGWEVIKTGHVYFRTSLPAKLARAMRVDAGSSAAGHAYRLDIAREGERFRYVDIVEIHHPNYLGPDELPAIYGPAESEELPDATGRLLAAGLEVLSRPGSTLRE